MNKILIADDESRMRRLLKDFLSKEGYEIIEASDGKEVLEIIEEDNIDLLILDIMMPKYDGWTVCRELRKTTKLPIIILTARSDESDELFGFELGADEYITKPFSPKILVARVKALFSRLSMTNNESANYGILDIDFDARRVLVKDQEILLTPKEYELLFYLVKNEGKALSRELILNNVWGYDYYGDHRTVDTHVKRLRNKLGSNTNSIQTVRGLGYRFEVN